MLSDSEPLWSTLPGKTFRCKWGLLETRLFKIELFPKVKTFRHYESSLAFLPHSKHAPNVLVQLPICEGSWEGKRSVLVDTLVLVEATFVSVDPSEPLTRCGSPRTTPRNREQTVSQELGSQRMLRINLKEDVTHLAHEYAWDCAYVQVC